MAKIIPQNLINKVIVEEISFLDDYKPHSRNREISRSHVEALKKSFQERIVTNIYIVVNPNTKEVFDGNHTLIALRELIEEGIFNKHTYVVVEILNEIPYTEEVEAIQQVNNCLKKWSNDDFLNDFTKDNENFKNLDKFCSENVFSHNTKKCIYRYGHAIIFGRTLGNAKAKKNKFICREEDLEIGNEVSKELEQIISILKLETKNLEFIVSLACSWHKFRNEYPIKKWMQGIKKHRKEIGSFAYKNVKDWDKNFRIVKSYFK